MSAPRSRVAWRALIEEIWAAGREPDASDGRLLGGLAREAARLDPPVDGASATEFAQALLKCAKAWAQAAGPRRLLLFDALKALADVVWALMEERREASIPNRVGLDV